MALRRRQNTPINYAAVARGVYRVSRSVYKHGRRAYADYQGRTGAAQAASAKVNIPRSVREFHVKNTGEISNVGTFVLPGYKGKYRTDASFKPVRFEQYMSTANVGSAANAENNYFDNILPVYLATYGSFFDIAMATQGQFNLMDAYAGDPTKTTFKESLLSLSTNMRSVAIVDTPNTAAITNSITASLPIGSSAAVDSQARYLMGFKSIHTVHNTQAYAQHFEIYVCRAKSESASDPLAIYQSYGPSYVRSGVGSSVFAIAASTNLNMHPEGFPEFKSRFMTEKKKFYLEPGATAKFCVVVPESLIDVGMAQNYSPYRYPGVTHYVWVRSYGQVGFDTGNSVIARLPSKYAMQSTLQFKILNLVPATSNLTYQLRPIESSQIATFKIINPDTDIAETVINAGVGAFGEN